jgi:tryptophanyl-tRNA synthetase
MITDPQRARRTDPGNPDICNLFSFHEIYSPDRMVKDIDRDCRIAKIGCVECKKIMAKNLCAAMTPIREKRRELESDIKRVKDIIDNGNNRAQSIARKTMSEVKEAVGISGY